MLSEDLALELERLGLTCPVPRRVLVVDDEPANLEVLQETLEDEWEVLCATSGTGALELLDRVGPVDLVIADQRMPGMTGVELLARVAVTAPSTVRIVLTGFSDVAPMLAAINRGSVFRFLLKPFDPAELQAVVRDALAYKRDHEILQRLEAALLRRKQELAETLEAQRETEARLLVAERMATLGRLTSGVVHDLGNHVSMMSSLLDLVRATTSEEDLLHLAQDAWEEMNAFLALMHQVRDYARAHTGAVARTATPVQLFLEDTLALFAMEDQGSGCPVQVDLEAGTETLSLDPGRVRQALLALLRNAAAASPPGAPVVLRVRRRGEDEVALEVRDLGPGMPPEVLGRAREPFFSSDDLHRLGLGLPIAELGAASHGGCLELESRPGQGTVAVVRLPGALPSRGVL